MKKYSLLASLVLTACSPYPPKYDLSPKTLRIKAFNVADSNCSYAAETTPEIAKEHFDFANKIFKNSKVGIQFQFDPKKDWGYICDTKTNTMDVKYDKEDSVIPDKEAQITANKFPDKVVVFFVWNTNGHSWHSFNYITMPDYKLKLYPGLFAHEAGHYLGLRHTFPPLSDVNIHRTKYSRKLEEYTKKKGLDGDGLSDTPEDAGVMFYRRNGWKECDPKHPSYKIAGKTYTPDRTNFMSYFKCGNYTVSPQQINLMHKTLATHPHKKNLVKK